jgi:hypothetical protein
MDMGTILGTVVAVRLVWACPDPAETLLANVSPDLRWDNCSMLEPGDTGLTALAWGRTVWAAWGEHGLRVHLYVPAQAVRRVPGDLRDQLRDGRCAQGGGKGPDCL